MPNQSEGTSTPPLRLGLIAPAEEAAALQAALASVRDFELAAQSGMPQSAALPGVEWIDDTRVLLAQAGVQALLIGGSTRAAVEIGNNALGRRIHVWHGPPLARSFSEAVDALRLARSNGAVLRVASWSEHAREPLRWALRQPGFRPVLSEVDIAVEGPPLQSWRSSQIDAGGGVLFSTAYAALEALSVLRGLPESVFGLSGRCRKRSAELARETDDFATALLRYEAGGAALLRAVWDIPPYQLTNRHHGAEATVAVGLEQVVLEAPDRTPLDSRSVAGDFLSSDLRRFAEAIRTPEPLEPDSGNADRHLAVSALLECVALSARNGTPESPRRLYEVQKWPEPKR